MTALPPSAARVAEAARSLGLVVEVREMAESTRTAEDAAAACGCDVGQIVKSLVFRAERSGRPVLLLVSGRNRVDASRAEAAVGEPLARADADYVREVSGYAVGGVPPIGWPERPQAAIDEDLLAWETVWAAAGTPRCVFAVPPATLAAAAGASRARLKP